MTDTGIKAPTYDSEILSNAKSVSAELRLLIDNVPEGGADAYERIIGAILAAGDVTELDAPWNTEGLDKYLDKAIKVTAIHRMPSDFTEGLGMYLVVDAVVNADGEMATFSTGAASVIVQLVKAHALNALPLLVIARRSKRPSANGYFPMHLEIVR